MTEKEPEQTNKYKLVCKNPPQSIANQVFGCQFRFLISDTSLEVLMLIEIKKVFFITEKFSLPRGDELGLITTHTFITVNQANLTADVLYKAHYSSSKYIYVKKVCRS